MADHRAGRRQVPVCRRIQCTHRSQSFYASTVPSLLPTFSGGKESPLLRWRGAPDLEAEADLGGTKGDNVYEITVSAWDEDWEIGSRQVNIRLANSNDAGEVTLSHIQPEVGTKLTATLERPGRNNRGNHLAMVQGTTDR